MSTRLKNCISATTFLSLFMATAVAQARLPEPLVASIPSVLSDVDLQRYQGIWYEIAHFREAPRDYAGARNAYSRYYPEPNDPTRLRVVDELDRLGGLHHSRSWAQLYAPNPTRGGELVRTGRTALGRTYSVPYHIYALDQDYTTAVVGEPNGQHLYVLSRTPFMATETLTQTVQWLTSHAAFADAASRLKCTTQAGGYQRICQNTLNELARTPG